MADSVLVERDGTVVTVTLNRPEKRNSLDLEGWARLAEAVEGLAGDGTIRCVVLRGAGEEAFSAGADIARFGSERSDEEQGRAYGRAVERALAAVRDCPHPTVAMIRGSCIGGGLHIAALCDVRICGESSRFGVPASRLGIALAHGEIAPLYNLVGGAAALELLLEARVLGAKEALEKGIVSRVVPDSEVEEAVAESVKRICEGAPIANRLHKKFVRRLADPNPLREKEAEEAYATLRTEDYRIGWNAYLEKKAPEFKGR